MWSITIAYSRLQRKIDKQRPKPQRRRLKKALTTAHSSYCLALSASVERVMCDLAWVECHWRVSWERQSHGKLLNSWLVKLCGLDSTLDSLMCRGWSYIGISLDYPDRTPYIHTFLNGSFISNLDWSMYSLILCYRIMVLQQHMYVKYSLIGIATS